jgi:hypothetical protein
MNVYNVEGAGRGNKLKNDDDVFKNEKFLECFLFWKMCFIFHISSYCPSYYKDCTPQGMNVSPPQAQTLP